MFGRARAAAAGGRTRPGFARRLWVARWRGVTAVGALVAVIVLLVIALGFAIWLQGRIASGNAVGSARKLVVLAGAVEAHVRSEYGTYAAMAAGQSREIDIDALRTDRLLPQGFDRAGDAMKRPHRAWAVSLGGGRVRLLSMQLVETADTRWPEAAVFEARGAQALGMVDTAGVLRGPTVQEDVTAFRAAAGGHPRARALAVYRQLDRESVCGDAVFRRERAGCPDSARMETDLDMGGNDLVGVRVLTAEELEVDRVMRAGTLRIDRALVVGTTATAGSVEVTGSFTVPDGTAFRGDAVFTGTVNADAANVVGALEAASADIAGDVEARNIEADANLTASGATVNGSVAVTGTGSFGSLSVGSCTGCN